MVVLTIDAPKNEHPIPKPRFVSLLSCSLYNTWRNLKDNAFISCKVDKSSFDSGPVSPGHYNINTLADYMKGFGQECPK